MLLRNSGLIKVATDVANEVRLNIDGRAADGGPSLPWVGMIAAMAGPGNHCDIGTLFGASAITAALCKRRLSIPGNVYCIDPYLPRDNIQAQTPLAEEFKEGNPEILRRNVEKFGLIWDKDVILVQAKSDPWPLKDHLFSSGFIDGNHEGDAPYRDCKNLENSGCALIGFDNYEEGYPDVAKAVHKVLNEPDSKWMMFFKDTIFLALRRHLPPRHAGTPLEQT